ncbi:MAG: helix-turn-helix transcriptional regulator [Pseudomonadota bacterium]
MTGQLAGQEFPSHCRQWRQYRKLSQLELAMEANVSQRHISWLETGRSKPSREMVIRLSEALDIPLRERNNLLRAAGFAAVYSERSLQEPDMAPVLDALNRVLEHHNPLPAVVIDRFWNVVMMNTAGELLFSMAEPGERFINDMGEQYVHNLAALTLHPDGFRQYITNWGQAAPSLVRRLRREAVENGDEEYGKLLAKLLEFAGPIESTELSDEQLLPVLPLELERDDLRLSLFSVISTFGTAQDITADELRVEAFYPGDSDTDEFFRSMQTPH